ncbi:hypothetical protein M378DRAFT_590958 [Amanita muscaria Koide BX008]|uniref:Uncharacterized protein n=1 Tax=Amanita muscaria (strain Koide BX008) TaxID=946122 RepID=A0A0C2W380_AMAMK|nr:hypothetical protein M378DRAFT_590958 [Amanita muscaria Koide BX008]
MGRPILPDLANRLVDPIRMEGIEQVYTRMVKVLSRFYTSRVKLSIIDTTSDVDSAKLEHFRMYDLTQLTYFIVLIQTRNSAHPIIIAIVNFN